MAANKKKAYLLVCHNQCCGCSETYHEPDKIYLSKEKAEEALSKITGYLKDEYFILEMEIEE